MSSAGKRDHHHVGDDDHSEELKRHKQDEGNIDAALLNEVVEDNSHHHHQTSHYDTAATAAAVANATYGDLIQHPGEDGDSKVDDAQVDDIRAQVEGAPQHHHRQEDDEEEEEEEEEEEVAEEDIDDDIKDPDHIPEVDHGSLDKHKGAILDDEDDDEEKKMFGGNVANGRRGRKSAPVTGSEEWKRQRKDSHKEVERRRRENINTAINKLSELLPVKESSKATILARAAEYIQKLKETESANIDKWTLQKLLSEQNQSRLTSANERLQDELGKAYKEVEDLKQKLKQAGVQYNGDDQHEDGAQDHQQREIDDNETDNNKK